MAIKEKEPPIENHLEWEETKLEKKDWKVWGKNLIKRHTTKQFVEDALLVRFKDQRTIQEKFKQEFFAKKMKELLILRAQQRDIIFEKFQTSMHAKKLKEQYGIAIQRALRASWHDILGLQFFAEPKDESRHIRMESMVTHFDKAQTDEFSKDIEEFESKTGFILGADKPALEEGAGKKTPAKPPPPKKMSKTTIKPIEETTPNPLDPKFQEEQTTAAKAFILAIKERKLKEFSNVLESLKKQKQIMLEEEEQKHAIDEEKAKKKREEDVILQIAQEKEEAEKQQIVEEEQKAIHDKWLLQQQEMREKSKAAFDLIQAHEHECYMMYFNDKADDINKEYDSWQIDIQAKRKKKWQNHYNFCFDILLQFVSMAECINEYRLEVGKTLPINEWRQWKNLFIKGALLPVVLPCLLPPIETPSEKELRIAKEESEAYLNETGEYSSLEGIEPIGKNKELGKFLVDIHGLAESLAKPFQQPDLSKFTLIISIVGVPNASIIKKGKTILAKKLATTYGILLIDFKKVQNLAINAVIIEEEKLEVELAAQPPNVDSNASPKSKEVTLVDMLSQKSYFGLQAKNAIENKKQVPDDVIVNLVLLTMLHPEEYILVNEINAFSTKGALPPVQKKSIKSVQPTTILAQQTGFILDGFPQTKSQVAALEKCLTGFDFEAQEAKRKKESKIAPPPQPEVEEQKDSGLHIYFIVETPPQDALLNQLSAYTIDPTTNIVYHPLTNPIPHGDKTGIIERLLPLKSKEEILAKIIDEIEIFNSMKDFLNKFNNIYYIPQYHDQNNIVFPNIEMAIEIVNTFIDNKAKERAENLISDNTKSTIEVAIQARKEVDIANNVAKALAKVFFKAKLAEVEVKQVPSSDALLINPKATKGVSTTKGIQVGKASDTIAKILDETTKIVLEVHNSATIATLASEEVQKLIHDFLQNTKRSLEATNLCKEKVEKALGIAKEASTKATIASNKCSSLLENAKILTIGESLQVPRLSLLSTMSQVEPYFGLLEEDVKPPPNLEFIKIEELAKLIDEIWQELEKKYLTTIQEGFRLLIHERDQTIPFLIKAKKNFVELLKEDNGKQKLFEDFQERWNRVEPQHRCEKNMMKRMYEEGIKFDKILCTLAFERLQNGKQVEQQSLEDLLNERTSTFTSIFTMLVQAELDRYIETCGLLHEYNIKKVGSKFFEQFSCNLSTIKRQPRWRFGIPTWLIPLEGSYPEFYMVLSEALAKASNLIDVIAGRTNGNKKLQQYEQKTRRMSGYCNTWTRVINPTFRETIHLDQDVKPIFSREYQIFCYRLELLAKCACKYLANLQPICDGAWGQMDEWLMKRCHDESSLIEEVRSIILEAAQEGVPLWYRVRMKNEFKVEEEEITKIVHIPPEPIIDLTPWHIKVMESIVNTFKTFSNGFEITSNVIKTTLSAIDYIQTAWKNAPQNNIYPRLPRYKNRDFGHFQHWSNLAIDIIEESKEKTNIQFESIIEWQRFLVSLVDAHFDYIISAATIEDIVQARMDFLMVVRNNQPRDPSKDCITLDDFLNIQLWFDKKDGHKFEDIENIEDTHSDNPQDEIYDLAKSLKTYVFSLLEKSDQHCKHKKNGLPWQTLLLYLCRDACFEIALHKAFIVLANTMSPDEVQLDSKELIQLLYPSGVDGALENGCIIWTLGDIEDVLFRANIEKTTPFVEPETIFSHISSNSKVQYEKDTIEQFFANQSSSHELQLNEIDIGTIEEFLSNVPDNVSSSLEKTFIPWQDSKEEELYFCHPQAPIVPKRLSVEDCITLNATTKLCSTLAAIFSQNLVHMMQAAPIKI